MFPRSPDITFVDKVPLDAFDTWNLRHRLFLKSDWTRDGLLDLVRIGTSDEDITIDVLPSFKKSDALGFAEKPLVRFHAQGPFKGYTHQNLGRAGPAILLTRKTSLTLVTR